MTPEVLQGPVIDPRKLVHRLLETAARRVKHGGRLWDAGLGQVVGQALQDSSLPGAMTPIEIARKLGVLKPVPRGIRGAR